MIRVCTASLQLNESCGNCIDICPVRAIIPKVAEEYAQELAVMGKNRRLNRHATSNYLLLLWVTAN